MNNHSSNSLHRTAIAQHAVDSLTTLLSHPLELDSRTEAANRKQADRMLDQLAADFKRRDDARRAVYGNRYPAVFHEHITVPATDGELAGSNPVKSAKVKKQK